MPEKCQRSKKPVYNLSQSATYGIPNHESKMYLAVHPAKTT